ncbi:MAG: glycosyltransferase [Phormidesmis sp.]
MPIDIAFSLNRSLVKPLTVVINSILRNTERNTARSVARQDGGEPLRFNVVVPTGDRTFFEEALLSPFGADIEQGDAIFRVQEYEPPEYLKDYLDNKFKESNPQRRLSRYMQYGRLFLPSIFPDMRTVIYLDCDTLVIGDVRSLYAQGEKLTPSRYLGAVPHFFPAVLYFSNPFKLLGDLRKFESTFNSGVLLTDLTYWTEATYDLLQHYLALDAENNYRLFHLGDETVFNLMFKDAYIQLDGRWNACGYGQGHLIAGMMRRPLEQMSIIHWSGGHHKPWESDRVIYSDLWRQYQPAV